MRAIQAVAANRPPASKPDCASAKLRGYRYDLRHFLAWHGTLARELSEGIIDRIMAMDDLELGLRALLGMPPSRRS